MVQNPVGHQQMIGSHPNLTNHPMPFNPSIHTEQPVTNSQVQHQQPDAIYDPPPPYPGPPLTKEILP